MTLICAWCQKVLTKGNEVISHGICPLCLEKHFPDVTER